MALSLIACAMTANAGDPYAAIIDLQKNGRYDEAMSQISHLLADNKDDFRALLLKGNVAKLRGDTEQAIKIFKQLIKQYPQMPEPYNNLAVLYADNGQTSLAIETLQQVFSTSHSYSAAFNNLRNLYNEMASSAYREALDINDSQGGSGSGNKYTLLNETAVALAQSQGSEQSAQVEMSKQSSDLNTQVKALIASWIEAWSSRNTKAYFAHYHQDFVPPDAVSRKEWERVRGVRLRRPNFIEIEVVGVSVSQISPTQVTAMFEQHYRSDSYKDTVVKVLTLKKQDDQWLILKEDVL